MKSFSRAADFIRDSSLFLRERSTGNVKLTELHCSNCCTFLGASQRPELLDFIGRVHICKTVSGQPPRLPNAAW